MQPEILQRVYVPGPDGNPVRGTVIAYGDAEDAVEVVINGRGVKRDVAIVRHDEGSSEGLLARVPYHLITAEPKTG